MCHPVKSKRVCWLRPEIVSSFCLRPPFAYWCHCIKCLMMSQCKTSSPEVYYFTGLLAYSVTAYSDNFLGPNLDLLIQNMAWLSDPGLEWHFSHVPRVSLLASIPLVTAVRVTFFAHLKGPPFTENLRSPDTLHWDSQFKWHFCRSPRVSL